MRNIISKSDNRKLQLVEVLSRHDDWTSVKTLSVILGCSERVIYNDIDFLKEFFKEKYFKIESSTSGLRLRYRSNTGPDAIIKELMGETLSFRLLDYIFYNDNQTVDFLAAKLHVSSSTLYRTIAKINEVFETKYQLHINRGPVSIEGNESDIRNFYLQFYAEKYLAVEWPFPEIEEKSFESFLSYWIDLAGIKVDFADMRNVKILAAIAYFRYKKEHRLTIDNPLIKDIFNKGITGINHVKYEKFFGLKLDYEFVAELFNVYTNPRFYFGYNHLIADAMNNETASRSYISLNQILSNLTYEYSLKLENREEVILEMHNNLFMDKNVINSNYIFLDTKEIFSNSVKNIYPCFHSKCVDYVKSYLHKMEMEALPRIVNHLVYILFVSWEGLSVQLQQKYMKIKALILSSNNRRHARMMKEYLDISLSGWISIEISDAFSLSEILNETTDYELIIANFSLPEISNKKVVTVHDMPSIQDIELLKFTIAEINRNKLN